MTAFETLAEFFDRQATEIPGAKLGVLESLIGGMLDEHRALLAEKAAAEFELFDKDDGKHAVRTFQKLVAVQSDEQRIFEETGLKVGNRSCL